MRTKLGLRFCDVKFSVVLIGIVSAFGIYMGLVWFGLVYRRVRLLWLLGL